MARAHCEDCPWSSDGPLEEVSDEAEEHERKERHDVDVERVATDGGGAPNDTVELRIRTDRVNLAGIMSVYAIGAQAAPTFGLGEEVIEAADEGMEEVYPLEKRGADLSCWIHDDAPTASTGVDVDLVELEDDAESDDDGPTDDDAVDIPVTDGGVPEIEFADRYAGPIRRGSKTVTYRYDFDEEFVPGQTVRLVTYQGEEIATARVATQFDAKAVELAFGDPVGHQSYGSTAELLEELREFYPEYDLDKQSVLTAIAFTVIDDPPAEDAGGKLVTDGGEDTTQGAIDNDFDDAERDAREVLEEHQAEAGAPTHGDGIVGGDVALDLVSRQPLYVVRVVAPDLPSYYESKEFDLATYKGHSWLPVRLDDPVLECIFIPTSIEGLHKIKKTYDYPAGRLARVPLGLAMEEDGDGDEHDVAALYRDVYDEMVHQIPSDELASTSQKDVAEAAAKVIESAIGEGGEDDG